MNKDWLWDRKISLGNARKILKDPLHPKYLELAALLLSRKNSPREIFKQYLAPEEFCRNWIRIRHIMKKDMWGKPRMQFWQAVYEKVAKELKGRGVNTTGSIAPLKIEEFCREIGDKIREQREKRGLTQQELARKLKISQQIISRIEGGRQNVSLLTIRDIASALKVRVEVDFLE